MITIPRSPVAITILAGLAALGLSAAAPAAQEARPQEKAEATPTPAPARAKPLVIPAQEKNRVNPVPKVEEAIESGRNLYATQCAMCHGRNGNGRGDLALTLKMAIPDLGDPRLQKRRTDGDWFYIISHGHSDMPAETRLVDQQKWEMVHYMRTLSRGESGSAK